MIAYGVKLLERISEKKNMRISNIFWNKVDYYL